MPAEETPQDFWLDAKLCIRAYNLDHAKHQLDAVLQGWAGTTLNSDCGLSIFDRTGLVDEETQ